MKAYFCFYCAFSSTDRILVLVKLEVVGLFTLLLSLFGMLLLLCPFLQDGILYANMLLTLIACYANVSRETKVD